MKVVLQHCTNDAINIMAEAARISHNSKSESKEDNEELLKKIIKWKHWSVLEHASATFIISDISRTCSHQLVRHRHLSIVQESQRYVTVDDPDFFIIPKSIEEKLVTKIPYVNCLKSMQETYESLLGAGVPAEDARFLLPNATKTTMTITGNFRTWREFIEKRSVKSAQWEIKELAGLIKSILIKHTKEFLWN